MGTALLGGVEALMELGVLLSVSLCLSLSLSVSLCLLSGKSRHRRRNRSWRRFRLPMKIAPCLPGTPYPSSSSRGPDPFPVPATVPDEDNQPLSPLRLSLYQIPFKKANQT